MGSAAEARERTPEVVRQEQTARKLELLHYLNGDAEQAQLLLNVFEQCERIAWAIQDDPSAVRRQTVNPYNALARTIYGDTYTQRDDLSLSEREARQATLGRLENTTKTFVAGLSPKDIREDGLDGTDLFMGVMQAMYPPQNGHDNGKAVQHIHDLALDYFTAGGGFERASMEQLR